MLNVPEIFARIYARHGHRCPMSTLGGRLGLVARELVGDEGEIVGAIYSNRTCALDGLAETIGCDEALGTLQVKNDGRHILAITTAGGSFAIELTSEALAMAGRYRSLCNRLEKGWDKLSIDEQGRRRAEMDAMLDELLPQLWQAEDEMLVQRLEGE